ncbi:hypothetical protein WR25_06254 [Diploscapter pachys]|uniref:Uncharacterized protein n=1 Tax=Diploscapter pachys TaxID=2018661 RepID=A0A2A2LX31_9BILA|nr:hypothetical protein WR25_06254 [Diploscapter pachys]
MLKRATIRVSAHEMRTDKGETAPGSIVVPSSIGGGGWVGSGAFVERSVGEFREGPICSPPFSDNCALLESVILPASSPFVDDCS